jgi:hypothetical protein
VGGALLFSTLGVKNWLARKDRASEITMDDLTAELRLRGLEPPYDAGLSFAVVYRQAPNRRQRHALVSWSSAPAVAQGR